MNPIVLTLFGLLVRHALSGVGVFLVGQGVDPKTVEAITGLMGTLGPVGSAVVGGLAVLAALAWSYWQKRKAGLLAPKPQQPGT